MKIYPIELLIDILSKLEGLNEEDRQRIIRTLVVFYPAVKGEE